MSSITSGSPADDDLNEDASASRQMLLGEAHHHAWAVGTTAWATAGALGTRLADGAAAARAAWRTGFGQTRMIPEKQSMDGAMQPSEFVCARCLATVSCL